MTDNTSIIPAEQITQRIYEFRGQKVMLDSDLAELYGVSTRQLNQQVRRNRERFPEDFMFQLSKDEYDSLISQFVTSKAGKGGRRKLPLVFTQEGVAMLSSVLGSPRAIRVNIEIMRAFIRMRRFMLTYEDLAKKIEKLEKQSGQHDEQLQVIFQALRNLMEPPDKSKRKIGFDRD